MNVQDGGEVFNWGAGLLGQPDLKKGREKAENVTEKIILAVVMAGVKALGQE